MLPAIREGLPDIRQAFLPLLDIWEGLLTTPGHSRGPPDHSWTSVRPPDNFRTSERDSRTSRMVSRPLPDIREALQ